MFRTLFVVGVFLLPACGSPITPEGAPPFSGEVISAGTGEWGGSAEDPFRIHVKETPGEECGVIFTITDETAIADVRSGRGWGVGTDVLVAGARVQVWAEFVLDSCPRQAHASAVRRIQ